MVLTKINILHIVKAHWATMLTRRGVPRVLDVLGFYVAPTTVAIALVYFKVLLTSELTTLLVSALSIIAGLLFNLLVLILNKVDRLNSAGDGGTRMQRLERELLSEVYANVTYCILIAIVAVVLVFFFEAISSRLKDDAPIGLAIGAFSAFSGFIYFLVGNFIATLLMILKRMHALFQRDLNS